MVSWIFSVWGWGCLTKDVGALVEIYEPELVEFEPTIEGILYRSEQLRIWKEDEQYYLWCDQCRQWHPIDKQTKKMVIDSHVCPFCFRKASGMKYTCDIITHTLIRLDDTYGYWVEWQLHHGIIKVLKAIQVAYWSETKEYVRNIIYTMSGCVGWWGQNYWRHVRQTYGYWKYHGAFYDAEPFAADADDMWEYGIHSKKEYYQFISQGMNLKSDQKKFISQGLYDQNQLEYIRAFDIHDSQTVHKYTKYMKKYICRSEYGGWNVHTLDYLSRNDIRIYDYADYCDMCRMIGRKPDKPKDFKYWHDQVAAAAEIKKNEQVSLQISKRSEVLPSYKKKATLIKPIASYEELMDVSKTLHNCIRTYAEKYANGSTDLFCMIIKGKLVGALEIRKNELIQARADHNENLPSIAMKSVHQFCTQIGATWRQEEKT